MAFIDFVRAQEPELQMFRMYLDHHSNVQRGVPRFPSDVADQQPKVVRVDRVLQQVHNCPGVASHFLVAERLKMNKIQPSLVEAKGVCRPCPLMRNNQLRSALHLLRTFGHHAPSSSNSLLGLFRGIEDLMPIERELPLHIVSS